MPKSIAIISDIHLSETNKSITKNFTNYICNIAPMHDELYILGDLFDSWIGDDNDSEYNRYIISILEKLGKKTKICCTRKTTPNLRTLEKYAVKKGGGYNHRYNLSDEILIKENHISASNNLRELVKKAIKTKKIITVEIENINQLKQVIGLKFKRILFDNMSYFQLKKCLLLCKNRYQTEYSGNATLKNIRQISNTGVNRISVGTITHSANSFDTTLLFR